MMLKRSTTESQPSAAARLVRVGLAGIAALSAVAALATGCLDRPVVKASPSTANVFVDKIVQTGVDKIDLLFMVDNSVSMADKQEILKAAVPVLVSRLISPICVDQTTLMPTGQSGTCPAGSTPEFNAVGDIHIGIVSSSLGAHGGGVCAMATGPDDHLDDKARLIPSVRPGAWNDKGFNPNGFLAWDASGKAGENVATALQTSFQNMITAVGEHGCGYEASLESWFRFLVDPEPPANVILANGFTARATLDGTGKPVPTALVLKDGKPALDPVTGRPQCTNCDETLLAQRRAFLRPDSLVAIVMLSDENDCSIQDEGVGWFVGSSARMPLSTKICETAPNDPCCRSCAQKEDGGPPKGCGALSADDTCKTIPTGQKYAIWDQLHDSLNLRCYNQHQRFGFDLLYPTGRYVSALTERTIGLQSTGYTVAVTNPLYDSAGSSKGQRDPSLVFLAGIVGVPWQDIATDASLPAGAGLTYLTAKQLRDTRDPMGRNRWDYLLGDPTTNPIVPPADPFMVETPNERPVAVNTLANVSIAPATSMNPNANAINGHEQHVPDFADLQYACTFPLKAPKDCMPGDSACDCSPEKPPTGMPTAPPTLNAVTAANSPLCQKPPGSAPGATQYFAKAYPGLRELTVLKALEDHAIVASICPKKTTATGAPESDPNYGYNPAVGAIIERLKEALKGKCLPRPIATNPDTHAVLCKVIEAQNTPTCDCSIPGRAIPDAAIIGPVRVQLEANGYCGQPGQPGCAGFCQCEIVQASGDELKRCQANSSSKPGYCYVDASTNPALISKCPADQPQLLNFVSGSPNPTPTPAQGAVAFIACLGDSVGASGGAAGM